MVVEEGAIRQFVGSYAVGCVFLSREGEAACLLHGGNGVTKMEMAEILPYIAFYAPLEHYGNTAQIGKKVRRKRSDRIRSHIWRCCLKKPHYNSINPGSCKKQLPGPCHSWVICWAIRRPVGVVARPSCPVSRRQAGSRCPIRRMESMTSSGGMALRMPDSAI